MQMSTHIHNSIYKCTNPVIACGFLNALFSFMLGSVSLFLLHPAFTSDNYVTVVDILPNFLCFAQPCTERT